MMIKTNQDREIEKIPKGIFITEKLMKDLIRESG